MARENNEEGAKKDYIKRQKANQDEKNAAMEKAAFQYNGKKSCRVTFLMGIRN